LFQNEAAANYINLLKTYLRIISYARPWGRFVTPFFVFSLLASTFGILNFTLLQPLLDVLFDGGALKPVTKPSFALDLAYFKDLFNYYLNDLAIQKGRFDALIFVCEVIVGSVFLSNLFRYLSVRILETVKGHTVAQLRQAVFDHAVHLHLGFFSNERKGNLMSRLTTDMQEVENSIGRAFSATFKEIFLLIGYFVALFLISSELTFFSLLIIPVSGTVIGLLSKKLKENAVEVQQQLGSLVSLLDETFGGMRVIKGFGAEGFIQNRFSDVNQGYYTRWKRLIFRQEMASPTSEFLGVTVVAGILLYGGKLVLSHESDLTASQFISYIAMFSQVMRPAKEISNAISSMQRGLASADRILGLLDAQNEIKDVTNALNVVEFNDKIEVQNVRFAYAEGHDVLHGINFTLPKGKTIALVGSSGGGKSTIADLIPRFYDPTQGCILIDGTDLREVKLDSLRSMMGIVTQESILFNDTIFNNIAFGATATEAEVVAAAQIANAHQFIEQLPDGYQTNIGDRGTKLSGGQRQRLSIARAVLKNPPILILDEATSALDTESEQLVQDALSKLMQNRTSLVIAHRLSTIQNADEILVVQQGQIVERGTHDSLMAQNGVYSRFTTMQQMKK
jgi:subfamily B ATP-binding cassette protein MsbA